MPIVLLEEVHWNLIKSLTSLNVVSMWEHTSLASASFAARLQER
jgi:hypothetical protein